jgi:ribonuclease H2 subunit A
MAEAMEDTIMEIANVEQETALEDVFMAPSIHTPDVLIGRSYAHHSPIPSLISADMSTECVLGVDEAGRGPVLGTFPKIFYRFF